MKPFFKINIIVLFFFLLYNCQIEKNKSGKKVVSLKDSISNLLKISKKVPFEKAKHMLEKAIFFSKELGNDSLYFKSKNRLAIIEYKNRNYKQFKTHSSTLLKIAFERKDTLYIAKAYYNLGSYYSKIGQVDTSYYHYNEAKRFYQRIKDSAKVGSSMLNMSILQIGKGDYYGSESTIKDGLSFIKKEMYPKTTRSLYNNFGIISYELKHYKDALRWYKKALKLTKNSKAQAVILNNIGIIYRDLNDYKNATKYFNKGLAIDLKKEEHIYAMLLDNLGYVHLFQGRSDALLIMQKAFAIRNSINNHRGQIVSKLHLGNYYLFKTDTTKSFKFLTSGLKKAKSIKDAKNLLKILKVLSENSSNAMYQSMYIRLKDSIYESERNYKHIFAKIKYRTTLIENEYDVLQTQFNKQANNLKKQEKQKVQYALLFGTTCILLILGFHFFNQRKKIHKQELIIEKLKAKAEEKQAISVHLHDVIAGDILLGLQHSEKLKKTIKNQEFTTLISIFERAYEKARKISQDLSQLYFRKTTFTQKVNNLCIEYSFQNDIKITHQGIQTISWNVVIDEVKIAIFGILQEALTNILKHAKASEVQLTFEKKSEQLSIILSDNGVGRGIEKDNRGIGLLNMQKRVKDLKGTITFKRNKPSGTIVHFHLPILTKNA